MNITAPGIYVGHYATKLGEVTLASDGERLVGLWFKDQKHYGSTIGKCAIESPQREELQRGIEWLTDYLDGVPPAALPEIRLVGTQWQIRVWKALLEIPRGVTVTYGELARRLDSSPRAVGGAVGRNPLSVIVPCHRVTGVNGLTGYAAGLEIKSRLLETELKERQ